MSECQVLQRQKEAGLEAEGSAQQQHQREREGLRERVSALQGSVATLLAERGERERSVARLGRDKASLRKTLEKVSPSVHVPVFLSGTFAHGAVVFI